MNIYIERMDDSNENVKIKWVAIVIGWVRWEMVMVVLAVEMRNEVFGFHCEGFSGEVFDFLLILFVRRGSWTGELGYL